MEIVIVRPGDSLWSIASRYGTSAEELARINQLNDRSRLVPKLALLVPSAEAGSRPGLEVNGYAYPNIAQSVLNETLLYLSYLCPFSYHMTTAGELIPIPDSTMVDASVTRTDVTVYRVPASELADQQGLRGLANMILLGALYKVRQFCSLEHLEEGLKKCIPARKAHLAEGNAKALKLGYSLV